MARSPLILDRYRVIDQAGSGGYGTVVHAFDTHLKRDVAIKCIELSEDELAAARLEALEARMAADLEDVVESQPVGARSVGAQPAARAAGSQPVTSEEVPPWEDWEEPHDAAADEADEGEWEDSMIPWGSATADFAGRRQGPARLEREPQDASRPRDSLRAPGRSGRGAR